MTRREDQLIRTRKILASLGIAFIIVVMLILSNDITTVYCTKCEEAWTMFECDISDEEKKCYICPSCENAKYRR